MPIPKILPHYTYQDLQNWEGKWELIDGIPYAMSPMPIPRHQYIAANLTSEFRFQLKKCKHCKTYLPLDYVIKDDIVLVPDLLIVCGEINKKFLDFPPALVAEVLSPSTALKDRHTKFGLYEQQGVKYYIIISPDIEEVEIYQLENGVYELKEKQRTFTFSFIFEDECTATIDFADIW